MKTIIQLPFAIKTGICIGAATLFSIGAHADEPNKNNQNEGTLVGAIQTLIKNNQKQKSNRFITGTIKIMQGEVVDPYVMVKGARVATFADKNGNFFLEVPAGESTLIVGGNGINERELLLNHEDHYDIGIVVEHENSNPYNVSLYGTPIDRRSYNGAFSRMSSSDIGMRAAVTVGTALEGAVAGLQVTGRERGLDGTGLNINIRGIGSFYASNAPLIVLDGAPYTGNLHSINPNDIGDITVLKDGIGKSMYGARGGNGIIILTTKRGNIR